MALKKITIPTQRELLIHEIESQIISGKLKVGEKLPTERELEEQTGVSKSVIHFALKDLEHIGFIYTVPRSGAYVADYAQNGSIEVLNEILKHNGGTLDRQMEHSLVELRNSLEGSALKKLCKFHTDEDISKLEACLDKVRNADKEISIDELANLTKDFHYLICKLSENMIIMLIMNAFAPIAAVLWRSCAEFWGRERFLEHDENLLELIKNRKGEEAQRYIENMFEQYLRETYPTLAE